MILFWSFFFPETYICYSRYFNLNCYIGKKSAEKFSYGFKNLVKLGVWKKKIKIWAGRTVFRKMTPNLTITNGDFGSNFEVFWNFFKKPLKVPSLARSVPKPLKVPTLARSVQKPLKVPSLASSVPKPLKVPSLARSVPKPRLGKAVGPQISHYHRCRPPTSWLWNEMVWNEMMNDDDILGLWFLWNFHMLYEVPYIKFLYR